MPEKRQQYDKDYKISAVKLLESSYQPLEMVARSLGISGSMLRRWRTQICVKGPEYYSPSGRQIRSEILRLRRENKELKRQIEVLKKTFGFQSRADQRNTKP
jgi:transposase